MSGNDSTETVAAVPPGTPFEALFAAIDVCNKVKAPKKALGAITLAGVLWHLPLLAYVGWIFFLFGFLLIVAGYVAPLQKRLPKGNKASVFLLGVIVALFCATAAYTALFVAKSAEKVADTMGTNSPPPVASAPVYNTSFTYAPSSERVSTVEMEGRVPPPSVKKKTSVSVHIDSAKSTVTAKVDPTRPTCSDSAQVDGAPDIAPGSSPVIKADQ